MGLLSEIATNGGHGESSSYFDGWKAYDCDPFHATRNPKGVIQMGLAENQLCLDLMEEWIKENPKASICTEDGVSAFKAVANFQDYHGLPAFRHAMANFMQKVRGGRVKFDPVGIMARFKVESPTHENSPILLKCNPDRIVMSGGATGAQELISFCLADPGDAFLIPTPYYPGFDRDFCWRTGARLLPVHCSSSNNFKITRPALESAFKSAQEANIRVKGVLITNPSNPLGTSMDRDTLQTLVTFINDKGIHLVCDEIFAGTAFDKPRFISLSEIIEDDPACNRDLIHVVYSLSKVLGLPGFRVGVVYSYNDEVVAIGRKMSSFGLVSSQTQHLLAIMLSDERFTSKLLDETARRLSERHMSFVEGLTKMRIRCLESNAGLFCWMDLRPMLVESGTCTVEGEMKLWRVIINEVKLNVSPGSSFHCMEPGWFRVCFANMDEETMEVALRRIKSFVTPVAVKVEAKKKRWQQAASLRLSLPRRLEDLVMSPHQLMSPHSPLVRATG